LPPEPIVAQYDARLLSQSLTNLIKNAVEAIEGVGLGVIRDPTILVNARLEGDHVRISVSDNGKGWPKENRQRLLEPYMTTREKGTGLGLAIVAKIIEQHGGTVELIDAEPDQHGRIGACFVFTLPVKSRKAGDENVPEPTNAAAWDGGAPAAATLQEEPQVEAVEE
jgi:two-component system nitrogen regulation sensor histidine kinase NtrY